MAGGQCQHWPLCAPLLTQGGTLLGHALGYINIKFDRTRNFQPLFRQAQLQITLTVGGILHRHPGQLLQHWQRQFGVFLVSQC